MDRETVDKAKAERDCAYEKYAQIKQLYLAAEAEWLKKKKVFEKYDYELALIDGRTKVFTAPKASAPKVLKTPELSMEQLLSIASKLGINIAETSIREEAEV